jgi:hypothetical protein
MACHAFCIMGTPGYELKQFYFIRMHSTYSEQFQLAAPVLMQISCWLIWGGVWCGQ